MILVYQILSKKSVISTKFIRLNLNIRSPFVPKKKDCENLLVPVACSASHIAYGSIRMEPVFMILGQSAATAASIAIDSDSCVQDVDYKKLSRKLVADGQILSDSHRK